MDRGLDQDVCQDRAHVRKGEPCVTPPVLRLLRGSSSWRVAMISSDRVIAER